MRRLHYLKDVLDSNTEGTFSTDLGNYRFSESEDFWDSIEAIFSHDYLHKYLKGDDEKL